MLNERMDIDVVVVNGKFYKFENVAYVIVDMYQEGQEKKIKELLDYMIKSNVAKDHNSSITIKVIDDKKGVLVMENIRIYNASLHKFHLNDKSEEYIPGFRFFLQKNIFKKIIE